MVTHPLTAEGFDASEDGTGRGTPIVNIAFNCQQDPISDTEIATGSSGGADRAVASALDCSPYADHEAKHSRIVGTVPRRLTPNECESLQGFPQNWTAQGTNGPIADGPRYRMLGNAVAVPCAEWLAKRIAAA